MMKKDEKLFALNNISPAPKSTKRRKIVGRGDGSKRGNMSGRGAKGQKSRAGGGVRPGFEGGQTQFIIRTPKMGKRSLAIRPDTVTLNNLFMLEKELKKDTKLTLDFLVKRFNLTGKVKVIGNNLTGKKFCFKSIETNLISKNAEKEFQSQNVQVIKK